MARYKHPEWLSDQREWHPGSWGKGFLSPQGLVHWRVNGHDGPPYHSTIQRRVNVGKTMAMDGSFYGDPTADFWINPHGQIAFWSRPGLEDYADPDQPYQDQLKEIGNQIHAQDPRLKSLNDWIDNMFYGGSKWTTSWPCPRCEHSETNADGSCPKCNYRPENGTLFERATADDPRHPWDILQEEQKANNLEEPAADYDWNQQKFPWNLLDENGLPKSYDTGGKWEDYGQSQACPECGEELGSFGDCENTTCIMSPDFYGYRNSSADWPNVVEAQSSPITVQGDAHHYPDRRPVAYLPHRNTVYVGQPASHHMQLVNEFAIPDKSGIFGAIQPTNIHWYNGVGMPEAVDDVLRERYLSNLGVFQ